MTELEQTYLNILNEECSPTSFTPEELLYSIRDSIFYSSGNYAFYTIEDLESFSDDKNKKLFSILLRQMKHKNDFGMMFIYFQSVDDIEEIILKSGYSYPPMPYSDVPEILPMKKVYEKLKDFFKDSSNRGANFNSIDMCPELGCLIAVNGAQVSTNRDFEQVLDHELNHYFEKMNIHYKLAEDVDKIIDVKDKRILEVLEKFYKREFSENISFIRSLKTHFFNYNEFRSISANVFHEILRYNETHLKQLDYDEFTDDIIQCNYKKYKGMLAEYVIFCWICKQISLSRWDIILTGIKAACEVKKNIFQKFFIKGKDLFRNLVMKIK